MRKPTILLADDHPLFRQGLKNAIDVVGLAGTILEAGDGNEAIKLAQTMNIDLFLLDYRMPDLDGYEASKLLLERNPKSKIVIVSMYSDIPLVANFFKLGIKGFLVKNSGINELEQAIRTVMIGETYIEKSIADLLSDFEEQITPIQFTDRERQLVECLMRGMTSKSISENLGLTLRTIETYRSRLLEKTSTKNTTELLNYFHLNGLIDYSKV